MAKDNKQRKKKRRKKRRKVNKLFVSAVAFFSAAVIIIFCIYYVAYETDYFNLEAIDIRGNSTYTNEFIEEKSDIELGEKIFNINRKKVKENIENEIYIKNVEVIYELPNRIYIEITERKEEYQVLYNGSYILTDNEGIVLEVNDVKGQLLTIESLTDVLYNIGDRIEFNEVQNLNSVFEVIDYTKSQFENEIITKYSVDKNNSIILDTDYGTKIKISLSEDIEYQITFAMKIINDRLNNNLTVKSDMIDFTKGDSPVYIEDFEMEDI